MRIWPDAAILKSFWLCEEESQPMGGITDMSVGVFAESATERSCRINISCTAGPNMYSPGVLACVYKDDTHSSLSLSFLLSLFGQPQAGPRSWFSEDVGACLKCCFAIWGASAGRRSRRKIKRLDSEAKKKNKKKNNSLFGEERKQQPLVANRCMLFPPCRNRLLIFQLKKSWKSTSERDTLRVV